MRRVALAALILLAACGPARSRTGDDDCTPGTCESAGKNCGTVSDGCGGFVECGTCEGPATCGGGGDGNVCGEGVCTPEPDAALCERNGKACGSFVGTDECGTSRRVEDCGACPDGLTCAGAGTPNVCGNASCTGESDEELCSAKGVACGATDAVDRCGRSRRVTSCGTCASPTTCGGGGTPGACGQPGVCTPESDRQFCSRLHRDCGAVTDFDNCDASREVRSCGSCASPKSCGGGGQAGVCGCRSTETNAQLCERAESACGSTTVTDACGNSKTVNCGSCRSPKTCGGGGVAHQCGCAGRETDAQLCQKAGANCGQLEVTDACGDVRTPTCGTCRTGECGASGIEHVCGSWTRMDFPGECDIRAIWGSGPNDVFVGCGSFGSGLYRWNGSSFATIDAWASTRGLAASASTNLWWFDTSTLAQWDGRQMNYFDPTRPGNVWFSGIATAGPNDTWVSTNDGKTLRLKRSGTTATWDLAYTAPSGRIVVGMWARSATDVWAVGTKGLVVRFDGSTWKVIPSGTTTDLYAVMGRSATEVYVSGVGFETLQWNGSSFRKVFDAELDGASAIWVNATDVLLSGLNSSVYRGHGGAWSEASVPIGNGGAVWASGPSDVWVGGMKDSSGVGQLYRLKP